MTCHKCGREINFEQFPLGLTFCPYCGDKLSEPDSAQSLSFCPYCGRRLLVAATFCPECGKRVAAGATTPHIASYASAPVSSSIPPPPRSLSEPEIGKKTQATADESLTPVSQPIWPRVVAICKRAYEPIDYLVTGRWRLKRLYQDWSIHDALPPDEIPSDDYMKNMSHQSSYSVQRMSPWLISLAIVVVILIFVIIGILIKRA